MSAVQQVLLVEMCEVAHYDGQTKAISLVVVSYIFDVYCVCCVMSRHSSMSDPILVSYSHDRSCTAEVK